MKTNSSRFSTRDALIRLETTDAPVNDVVRVHFTHNSGERHLLNGTIPIVIA